MAFRFSFLSFVFVLIAGYFLYVGISLDTSVPTDDGAAVANFQLMHAQAMNIGIGIAAAIIASIFATGAAIIAVSERRAPLEYRTPAPSEN